MGPGVVLATQGPASELAEWSWVLPPLQRIKGWVKRCFQMLAGGLAVWGTSHLIYQLTAPPCPPHPRLIAHRGGAALAPENTLAAFRQAVNLKVDLLETDVRQSRDGELVLMHDSSVSRTTSGTGSVESLLMWPVTYCSEF